MADKRISDLTSASTLTLADLLVLVNDSQTKKTSVADLLELIANQEQFAELGVDGKIPAELLPDSIFGALTYQASWNATTNTPALPTAAAENKGWYYVVSTDGTTNVNGISDWKTGDWVVSNGSVWQKVDNTDAVASWNGRTGAVMPESGDYTTSTVPEGSNLYYTSERVLEETLSGLPIVDDEITSADSILDAIGKAQGQINERELTANKGVANGYASLDSGGKLTSAQLPSNVELTTNKGAASGYASLDATTKIPIAQLPNLGTVSATNSAITTGDSIPTAFNKAQGQIAAKESIVNKGAANGYASLDSSSKLTASQLPSNVELTTNKGTASGYASLDSTTKIPIAQLPNLGTVTASNTAIATGDSIPTAFNKAQGQIAAKESIVNKGAANGYASLDSSSKLTASQLPSNVELNTNKGVASGYASLDSSTKIPIAQLPNLGTVSATNSAITTGDSIPTAFNKTQGQINAKESTANKGVANGYASLDSGGRLNALQIPSTVELNTNKGAASGYASLDSASRLPKAQLTRGQTALDMDFTGYSQSNSTETLKYSFQVPANVFAAGDQLNIEAWVGGTNSSNAKTVKIYLNTSASLSGATAIGTYTFTTGVMSVKMSREVSFISNTTMKCGILPATSSVNGESTSTLDNTATTIPNITNSFYVIISLKGFTGFPSGDSAYLDRVVLKGLYQ